MVPPMNSFCTFAEQCGSYDRVSHLPGFTEGHNLCDQCWAHSSGDVYALLFDYLDLSQLIARRDGHSDAKIARPKPASTPPIDLNVDTLRSDMAVGLLGAEVGLRRALAVPVRVNLHVREGFSVQQSVSFVGPRVDALAGMDEIPLGDAPTSGVEVLTYLRELHRRARRVAGLSDLTIALPGPCPKCAVNALSRRDGSDTVNCGSCRHAWPWADYQKHVTLQVTEISLPSVAEKRGG